MFDMYGRHIPDYIGQQPWQDPAYLRGTGQTQQAIQPQMGAISPPQMAGTAPTMQQPVSGPMMTPPTIRAEIVQIDGETAIANFPVNAGSSQMMMAKDESFIAVKSMLANGQYTVDFYDKRPPAPPEPAFDPSIYVRRDELQSLVADAIAATQTAKRTAAKKEESDT